MLSAVFSTTPLAPHQKRWLWLILFLAALLPRLVALNRYITPDELIWVFRSVQFSEALAAGEFAQTLVAGHPGVTTLWLASAGIWLQTAVFPNAQSAYQWVTQLAYLTPDNNAAYEQLSQLLTGARLPVILINTLGTVVATWLASRWRGRKTAVFLFLFLALDPFIIGLSSILHVDALLTTFATISLLAIFVALDQWETHGWRMLLLSALAAGLALISKSPALLLPPFAALLLLANHFSVSPARSSTIFTNNLPRLITQGLSWLTVCLLTAFILFPALWSDPTAVLDITSSTSSRHIGEALRPTFFLGETTFEHGWHFYPIALAFRLGPLVFVGLLAGIITFWQKRSVISLTRFAPLLWVILFILGLSLAAKKFDRYLLPAIPMLALLAAIVWARWSTRLAAVAIALQLAYWLFFSPYPLAAYNPLLGGPWVADLVMPIGWGEGQSAAARWLSQNVATTEETAVSGIPPTFAPFFVGQTLSAEQFSEMAGNYLILTRTSQQVNPVGLQEKLTQHQLLHTLRYGGVAQAWIFRQADVQPINIAAMPMVEPVRFAGEVTLLAASAAPTTDDDVAHVNLQWQLVQPVQNQYLVRLTLRDAAGNVWREVETLLLNNVYHPPQFWQPNEMPLVQYDVPLTPHMPPVAYQVEVALFDALTNAQLSVQGENGRFIGTTISPATLTLPARAAVLPTPAVSMQQDLAAGRLRFYGHDGLPPRLATGTTAIVDFYWQANQPLPPDLRLTFALGDVWETAVPLGLLPSEAWLLSYPLQAKYQLVPPPTAPAGVYPLTLSVDNDQIELGEIELLALDRLFSLPEISQPLDLAFDDLFVLRGFNLPKTTPSAGSGQVFSPGDTLDLTLYWQAQTEPDRIYSTLLHLRDEAGNIVTQGDQWPGGLPTVTLADMQVIIDGYQLQIPDGTPNGRYSLVVGLYDPQTGQRLTTLAPDGSSSSEFTLPIAVIINE